jgi:hypothetical protein
MMAAFSMTLDQCDDKAATSQCLQGFRSAVHVTSVMGMQTQRDAFVTSVAKFTYLHCVADMKQKNVDAVKVGTWKAKQYIYVLLQTPTNAYLDLNLKGSYHARHCRNDFQ